MPRDFLKVKWVVRWFAMVMQRKLQDNNHKPPWWEQENSYLLMRLQQVERERDLWKQRADESLQKAHYAEMDVQEYEECYAADSRSQQERIDKIVLILERQAESVKAVREIAEEMRTTKVIDFDMVRDWAGRLSALVGGGQG